MHAKVRETVNHKSESDLSALFDAIMAGPTMQRVFGLAAGCPINTTDPHALKRELTNLVLWVSHAIDQEQIQCNPEADTWLHALLTLALEAAMDGRLAETLIPVKLDG